jgi:hypothetical protein
MPQIPSDPELKAIESALGELIPRSSRLDRDKLMFQAGAISKRASGRRWAWPAITAALGVALAGESLFLGMRPAPRVVERIVFVPAPSPATDSVAIAGAPVADSLETVRPENAPAKASSSVPRFVTSPGDVSDYQRFQNLVIRFGLDALPERPSVVLRADGGDFSPARGRMPAGTLRNLELERILKPGDSL